MSNAYFKRVHWAAKGDRAETPRGMPQLFGSDAWDPNKKRLGIGTAAKIGDFYWYTGWFWYGTYFSTQYFLITDVDDETVELYRLTDVAHIQRLARKRGYPHLDDLDRRMLGR